MWQNAPMMDSANPAVTQRTAITPAMLEEVEKDAAPISAMARKMLLVQIDALHYKFRDLDAPIGQRQAFAEFLAKVGDAMPKASNTPLLAGSGFSVNIIMSQPPPAQSAPAKPTAAVEIVDVAAKQVVNGVG
jgi:hypothetical protein